jgi:hypothetical protein
MGETKHGGVISMVKSIDYKIIDSNKVQISITLIDDTETKLVLNKDDVNSFVFKLDAMFNDLLDAGENNHAISR